MNNTKFILMHVGGNFLGGEVGKALKEMTFLVTGRSFVPR